LRIWQTSLLIYLGKITGFYYKSPGNFNYLWNFGFLALYFLLSQIITGIFLAMFYNPDINFVFGTVFDITSEIYYGWLLRGLHANGASFFFFVVYLHMSRNVYYSSFVYPRQFLWLSGSLIWVLMIATAFLGYVLPWGQMSFWGAMVITSLLGALPGIGNDILFLLWGSYSIDNVTLHRFYSLHYTLPFIILIISLVHLSLLHEFGSNSPLGVVVRFDHIPMIPYYSVKDAFSIIIVLIIFLLFVILMPDKLGHSDNFILANSLVTPAHIVPEWYFLPLYAILRSVTNKLLGVALIGLAIICIFLLPYFCKNFIIRSGAFRPIYGFIVAIFFVICLFLGWIGSLPVMSPYLEVGQLTTFFYFVMIFYIFPFSGFLDQSCYQIMKIKKN